MTFFEFPAEETSPAALKVGPVVRKVDSAIHRIVIFSTVVKMLEKL